MLHMDKSRGLIQEGTVDRILDIHDAVWVEHRGQRPMKGHEQQHAQDTQSVQVITAFFRHRVLPPGKFVYVLSLPAR